MPLGDRAQDPIPVGKPIGLFVRSGTDSDPCAIAPAKCGRDEHRREQASIGVAGDHRDLFTFGHGVHAKAKAKAIDAVPPGPAETACCLVPTL